MKRIFLLLVALLCLASAAPIVAQDATATPVVSPALSAQMDTLEATTRALRGLDGKSVVREFPSRAETIHYLTDALAAQLPADQAERYLHFYTAFDLLPANTDLRAVYLRLLGAQVAGFYDSETKVMHVVPTSKPITDKLSLLEQIIYVHEYTHALQDQFFGLQPLLDTPDVSDNPDRTLAAVSLVEGDATNVMVLWLQQVIQENPLAAFQLLGESAQTGGLTLPAGTPPILGDELLFPYETGLSFVTALQRQGGMNAVNQAFMHPPTTTTQIMHPQKYIAGWQPIPVTLSDSAAALGAGWKQVWDSTLGEWYLGQYLKTQIGNAALKAADGWQGDRFHIYVGDNGAQAWVLRLVWEDEAQMQEFVTAYRTFAAKRSGSRADSGCWTGARDVICLRQAGQQVILAQGPDKAATQALLDAQAA